MIRWIILAVLIVVAAAAIPLAVSYLPADVAGPVPSSRFDEETGPPPQLVFDGEPTHDFGLMSEQDRGDRAWTLRNEGEGTLQLRFIEKPCTCTGVTYGEDKQSLTEGQTLEIEPGEQVDLAVAWETRDKIGEFSTYARFATNDYEHHPTLSFMVKGVITPAVVVDPPRLDFPAAPSDQESSLSAIVFSPTYPELSIESNPTSSRPGVVVPEVRPLTDEELEIFNQARLESVLGHSHGPGGPPPGHDHEEELPKVTAGYVVTVTLKPGLPLGRFSDLITLMTDHPIRPMVELPIGGQIVGPIAAMPERLYLPGVDRKQGRTVTVMLNVRNHERTTFTVRVPDALQGIVEGTVEPVSEVNASDQFRQYRLQVTIPQGARPGIHKGVLLLETDHPQAEEVKVPVEVLVRGG
ncbi:DUF1573 domain-containing protein [Tautonia rosea]|uniref:DUF1573 domain-containing protein n=1 Tax=Tautonia rosea TaxID=2728037 RepID=UPI001473C3E4|nr:DUF1573 domain-containing protein [Tautonia rosea]